MKRILITGVAGFIGSHVARKFIKENYMVYGWMIYLTVKKIFLGLNFIYGDLSKKMIEQLPKHCDLILHLAGQSSGEISFDDPIDDLCKNTITTLNLIHYELKKVKRIIYASSMSV